MNSQNENPKHKKIKPTPYEVGEGNFFVSYPSFQGYKAYGKIAGKHIQMEGKDLSEIENKLLDFLANIHRECAINLSDCEGLSLKIKLKGLDKLIKNSEGDKK
jgi:hypothetical protein